MNKLFATAVATALLVPTLAAAEAPAKHQFTRDGQTYVYTSAIVGARQVIDGYSANTGARFHLVVRNGIVSGVADGQSVSFRAPAVRAIETAAR